MIPNPYVLMGALVAFIGVALGGFFYGEHVSNLSWTAAVAQQKTEAANLLADAQAKITLAVSKQAEANDQIEATHAKDQAVIDDAYVAYSDLVSKRVQPRCGPSSAGPGSAKTADPGSGPKLESPGIWISEQAARDLGSQARDADLTVAAMSACKAWALGVGRVNETGR